VQEQDDYRRLVYVRIITVVGFFSIIHHPDLYLKTTFRRLNSVSVIRLKPTQLGLILISEHQNQHKTEHVDETQHGSLICGLGFLRMKIQCSDYESPCKCNMLKLASIFNVRS
jgi:hypothetical protein